MNGSREGTGSLRVKRLPLPLFNRLDTEARTIREEH